MLWVHQVFVSILVFLDFNPWDCETSLLWLFLFQSLFSWILTCATLCTAMRCNRVSILVFLDFNSRSRWSIALYRQFQSLFSWILTYFAVFRIDEVSVFQSLFSWILTLFLLFFPPFRRRFQSLFSWILTFHNYSSIHTERKGFNPCFLGF